MVAAGSVRPLPSRPAERGEFLMEVSFYGGPPGWWLASDACAVSLLRDG
jgi:hypothetical protein